MKENSRILMIAAILAACFLGLVQTLCAQVATNLATVYSVVDLGGLPGLDTSFAREINDADQVIGISWTAPGVYPNAGFIWDATNGMRNLNVSSSGGDVQPCGINSQGVVAGYSWDPGAIAFVWDPVNGAQYTNFQRMDNNPYYAVTGINNSGAMPYGDWNNGDEPPGKSYLLSGGTATWIGELFANGNTEAEGINNKNEIVGDSTADLYGIFPDEAFFWNPGQGIVGLGVLPGYTTSIALRVNDASQVVGESQNPDGTSAAFIWTSSTGMVQLDCNRIGGSNSCAYEISAGGLAVGSCQINGSTHAVVWPPGQGVVDLNTLVTNMNGWVSLTHAFGVNSSGIIVGDGMRTNGVSQAFILYPAVTVSIKMFAGLIINNAPIGSSYLIQATSNLAGANWTTLTNVAIPTQPYIFIDYTSYTNTQQFYRVVPQ